MLFTKACFEPLERPCCSSFACSDWQEGVCYGDEESCWKVGMLWNNILYFLCAMSSTYGVELQGSSLNACLTVSVWCLYSMYWYIHTIISICIYIPAESQFSYLLFKNVICLHICPCTYKNALFPNIKKNQLSPWIRWLLNLRVFLFYFYFFYNVLYINRYIWKFCLYKVYVSIDDSVKR